MRLDKYEDMPEGLKKYLSFHGWHFSKKLCEFAVSKMYTVTGRIAPYSKEALELLMKRFNVVLKEGVTYDAVYVANMCKADFLNRSVVDESRLCMYVRDYIDDPDGYEGMPFTRYYADIIGSGTSVDWEDMI